MQNCHICKTKNIGTSISGETLTADFSTPGEASPQFTFLTSMDLALVRWVTRRDVTPAVERTAGNLQRPLSASHCPSIVFAHMSGAGEVTKLIMKLQASVLSSSHGHSAWRTMG